MSSWNDAKDTPDGDTEQSSTYDAETGIRTTVYHRKDNRTGQTIKVTKKVKEFKKKIRVNKNVEERKRWTKFGACANLPPGPEKNITYQTQETINLDLRPDKKKGEDDDTELNKLAAKGQSSVVVCRNCGETGHWTLKCPYRKTIVPKGQEEAVVITPAKKEEEEGGETGKKWVPFFMRGNKDAPSGGGFGDRSEEYVLRVTNLSQDTREHDLKSLFKPFEQQGRITRTFLAKDKQTGESRGFAFINFSSQSDAANALEALHGHGYDNLILHVEWGKAREPRGDGQISSTAAILAQQKRKF